MRLVKLLFHTLSHSLWTVPSLASHPILISPSQSLFSVSVHQSAKLMRFSFAQCHLLTCFLLTPFWTQRRATRAAEDQVAGLTLSRILSHLSTPYHIFHSIYLWGWPWSCTKAKCSLPHLKGPRGSAFRKEEDEAVGLETSRKKTQIQLKTMQ